MSLKKIPWRLVVLTLFSAILICAYTVFTYLTDLDESVVAQYRDSTPPDVKNLLRPFRAPQVLLYSPSQDDAVSPKMPITITFLTPMLPFDNAIQISPTVKARFAWNGNQVAITPEETWLPNTPMTVTVSRDARSWAMRRADKEFTWSFKVSSEKPHVTETYPENGTWSSYWTDELEITFDRDMDRASVESHLSIDPPIDDAKLHWNNNGLTISELKPITKYHVVIAKGAQDNAGVEMPDDFEMTFATGHSYPFLGIPNLGWHGVVAADMPATLKLQAVNISRVDATIDRIGIETLVKSLSFTSQRWREFNPEGEQLRRWSFETPAAVDENIKQGLQIDPLPAGIYYLRIDSPEKRRDQQILISTKTALTLKRTLDNVFIWATNISDGAPVSNLDLTFYNAQSEIVGVGRTNQNGLFQGTIRPTPGNLHVVGIRENDIAVVSDAWNVGIEPWRFDNVEWQENLARREHRVFVYTDRPLYRPGQTVFFKAIVRGDADGTYSQPPAGTPVEVSVLDESKRVVYKKQLETTAFGSLAGSFTLNSEAGLGTYQIVASIDTEQYQTEIQVEEYRKPEYSVTVKTDRPEYISGDAITATIGANYFFGGAVFSASVHWTLYANDYYYYWNGGDYDFAHIGERRYNGYGRELMSKDAVLDANGELVVKLSADLFTEQYSQVYTLEATVTDEANQPQAAVKSVLVHRGDFYIGLKPANYVADKGKPVRFDVQTVDTTGETVGKIALDYVVNQIDWNCYSTKNSENRYVWRCNESQHPMRSGQLTTDVNGVAHLVFTPPTGGAYRLEAQGWDTRGNRVLGQTWVWVSDYTSFVSWQFENQDRINLIFDKKQYQIGETAKMLIQSPYPQAQALVTIERGKLISRQFLTLTSNSATLDIPIVDAYFPNVYVGVMLIPTAGAQTAETATGFKMGLANINVVSNAQHLDVKVTSNGRRYTPGEKATYTIQTRDADGKPVSAEVSLAVVDKAVLALAGNSGPDIYDAFYKKRALETRTSNSLVVSLARVSQREDLGGGGGGEEEERKNFVDVAYWNPIIVTDANGNAKVDVEFPDNLTTWTATANGMTASTQVGAGAHETIVTKDLLLRPVLPRFLTVGDNITLGAIVRNSTEQTQTVTISLNATNLTLPQTITQTVEITAGQSVKVNWNVNVPDAGALAASYAPTATVPLSTTITLWARGQDARDGIELSLPIEPFGKKYIVANAGQMDRESTQFTVTAPVDASFTTLKLSLSPSLAASMLDSLEYLTGYPYGCTEQTMSRFLPDVVVKQTLDKLKIKNAKLETELPRQVAAGLNRLYNFQHKDGGWGWWENDESEPYKTAYILGGLLEAKKAGYTVDENSITRATRYLINPLVDTHDYDLKTYIAYVMTDAAKVDPGFVRVLAEKQSDLSLYSRALLALMLDSLGEKTSAAKIVSDLENHALENDGKARWEERSAYLEHGQSFNSHGRTTATVLRAILAVDPQSPLAVKAVRQLMENRQGGYWRTTQETAQTIIALTDYLAHTGELDATFAYTVSVDGTRVATRSITREDLAQYESFIIPLAPGDHAIRISKSGTGRLYFTTALQYIESASSIGASKSSEGPTIQREYLDRKTGKPLTEFKVGDIVRVKLTLDLPREQWYVMITDPLPAGFEAINYSLSTTGVNQNSTADYYYNWARTELHDDRATFFSTRLWPGKHVFTYLIRATSSGTFRAMPAEITPMYEPEVFGTSASAEFVIR